MGAGITFDDSLWPLLISRFRGSVSDADFEEYLVRGAAYLRRGELYVSVLDMGRLALPTAAQRQRQLEWMRDQKQALREQLIGCAFLLDSPIIRLTLSTIFHVVPLPSPYVAVSDLATGARWASVRLEEHGLIEASLRVQHHFGLTTSWDAQAP
ncbi:hypothetical protein [Melittangium boletus]|uniref:Uncharacterized protein n=1 Tax=Melittangium boletus DSM 14713 TaxID=1294270 RepID=A0A250IQM7_9BACT|nr:hypothetical protein [Melittangium boletus]ATB34055.1 hypothetical protein MEBOL_007556 [Melittangium boletus DSM 14713]